MAGTPQPESYEQILGSMLSTYMSKISVNDLNTGSAVTSFFETMAQAVYRASADIFSILRDFSVDRATGEALQRLREEEGLPEIPEKVATGRVTIVDTSFTKQSTKVYAGSPPPNIGSTTINVSDASAFTASGSIYIGRGTPNVEGPLSYASITNVGSFFTVNLSTPTTKYHNISESVILAQGGVRNINAGEAVKTTSSGSSPAITFTVTKAATILDGETTIENIPVAGGEPGTDGNVPRNAIKEFATAPFTGATVTNPSPYTTGRAAETDEQARNRIKRARISRGLGTALAVKNAVLNAQAPDENAIVTSNEIFTDGSETTLFIDNGEGYEEKTSGIGLEFMVDSALGGEERFQLATAGDQTSVAKAFILSSQSAPFNLNPNNRLAILVGGILSEHVFLEGDFRSDGAATAFEVIASINGNADLKFSARTVEEGTQVVLSSKLESEEFIQKTDPTTGTDAGEVMGFPTTEAQTLRLYKNNKPLNRNGRSAVLETQNQSDWSNTITNGDTIILIVDDTSSITYTIINADFLDEGTHSTVAKTNTLASWINVFNSKITGVTASQNGNRIVFTSNLGAQTRAKLVLDPTSTLVTKGMFNAAGVLSSEGTEADFTLSRNTAQVKLTSPLEEGDSLTSGSDFTRGFIESTAILGGNLIIVTDAELWFTVDNQDAAIISHGVSGDSEIHITKEASGVLRVRSVLAEAFGAVQPGDYVVLWSDEVNSANRVEGRVIAVGTASVANDFFEIKLTAAEYAAAVVEGPVTFSEGLAFIRSDVSPQKVKVAAGAYNINTIATNLESQLLGVDASTENDEIIILATKNKDFDGSILLFTFNGGAKNISLTLGALGTTTFSHFGFLINTFLTATRFPLFIHSSMAQDRSANPPDTFIADFESSIDLTALGVDPNVVICMQNPYLSNGSFINDAQAYDECVQIDDITGGTTVDIDKSKTIRRIRVGDRYYVVNSLDFDFDDDITFVLDNNASDKTFPVNLFRRAITNNTQPINANEFRAYDTDAGPTTEFSTFFGSSYAFKNYKAMMQAKNGIDPTSLTDEDAILYRAVDWGRAGEGVDVGYIYPAAPSQAVASLVTVTDKTRVRISLKSGAAVANNIDGTTEWDVTITPNTPVLGVEETTFTWNTTGTNPVMATLAAGDYITINQNGEFAVANTGTFRISSATSTSFTVRRPSGSSVAETGKATLTTNTISLFEDDDTTAQEIVDHVTANLTDWITATVLDDNGTSGAGIINLNTHEDNSFALNTEAVTLVDGLNWISTSTLGAGAPAAQFELKQTLSLSSFSTNTADVYAFNDGEEIRLIPTTISHLVDFFNVLAVTGFQTLGEISTTERDERLQLATQILGSGGAIKVSGGSGNSSEALIVGTSSAIANTDLMKVSVNRASSSGMNVSSWLKLVADNAQKKITGISTTTQITITPNVPLATESIIKLTNQELKDRYFGQSRNNFRSRSRAFHVEKHGSLVNISWNGVTGGNPAFTKTVEFNDVAGGNMSVVFDSLNGGTTEYTIETLTRNFAEVSIGDLVVIQNFADTSNNGTFRVLGISDDGLTISTSNTTGVAAASAAVAAADLVFTTEIREGDTVQIATSFSTLNQGQFRVIRRYTDSIYIENSSAIEERVIVADNLRALGFDGTTEFDVTVAGDMTITWNTNGTTPTLENARMGDEVTVGTDFAAGNQGTFMCTDSGDNFIRLANSKGVAEANVTIADVLEAQIPALQFDAYENTVPGDQFVISGDVLTAANQGTYNVTRVISKTQVAVADILVTQSNVQLNELFVQVFAQEGVKYTGFKQIAGRSVDPANSQRVCLIFDTKDQFEKIVESGSILANGQSKLGYGTSNVTGFDSYKYHTGLIRQANKIVYGDPRDNVTFPGVAAAGAEIFIQPPLIRRILISINIRVNTGIPFVRVAEQVRNNIAALINSSDMGVSIAISDIISTVNSINGVKAVSISSPTYDPQNDVIVINPSEKPFIQDILNDIVVSKVGN